MRGITCCLSLAGTLLAAACGMDSDLSEDLATSSSTLSKVNGGRVNGGRVNGGRVNGNTLSGTVLLSGSELTLTGSGQASASLSGSSLVGAILETQLANGEVMDLRIDSVSIDAATSLRLYGVSFQQGGRFQPLCGQEKGKDIQAIALSGQYDEITGAHIPVDDYITFGCLNGAIGKCALWGYHPWETRSECTGGQCKTQSMDAWHQACIRMVRADYCGDGVPHTREGTLINVWDNLAIQLPDVTSWEMEAEWSATGAHCIRHTRWVQADKKAAWSDLGYVQRTCPSRLAVAQPTACNESNSDYFATQGLQVNVASRRLLRNESQGWLTGTGKDKKGNRQD